MEKIRTNLYLTPVQKKQLEKLSRKTGSSVAELARQAINDFLDKNGRPDKN